MTTEAKKKERESEGSAVCINESGVKAKLLEREVGKNYQVLPNGDLILQEKTL